MIFKLTSLLLLLTKCSHSDLVVNVRNQGGESYKQTIRANLPEESVTLSFDSYDGSSTTMVIDFRNEIQLVHSTRLGDQEESDIPNALFPEEDDALKKRLPAKKKRVNEEPQYAVYKSYCFVTKFSRNEFIPVDAMAKLRQKNPWSLRTPERTEPIQNVTFDILLDPTASDWISPAIRTHCSSNDTNGFTTTTYAIKMQISERAVNPEDYLRAVRDVSRGGNWRGCKPSSEDEDDDEKSGNKRAESGCVCSAPVCIGWYPCALKFCRARSSSVNTTLASTPSSGGGALADSNFKTYRCGIHTCRVCRNYIFGVTGWRECV